MKSLIFVIAFLLFCSTTQSFATTITYDFNSGLDSNFSTFNGSGLYNIDTSGSDLRISKQADDGSFNPNSFITAGIKSNFTIDGDFMVTIDFTLNDFLATGVNQLNESLLSVVSTSGGGSFSELRLRFRLDNRNFIEVFSGGSPLGVTSSAISSGNYRIMRSGSTVTGLFSLDGLNFNSLGSVNGFTGGMYIMAWAAQGTNGGTRSNTSLDISFDNLVIEADQFNNISEPIPEPATIVLLSIGLFGLAGAAVRQRLKKEKQQ